MARRRYTTFLDLPAGATGDLVIQGAPCDLATTGRPGTRLGPAAIRAASHGFCWEPQHWPWDFALTDRASLADAGDVDFAPGDLAGFSAALQARTAGLIVGGARVLTLGGDHYTTLPLLRAHHAAHGPLALVQFDAHTDTDVATHDHHGVMFTHALAEGLIDPAATIQIGIRTWHDRASHPFAVLDADWVDAHGALATARAIQDRVGARAVYLSFDIDALDPAFAPGTGTPVPGGLATVTALRVLRALAGLRLIGADVVEVSPPHDPAGITALAGAGVALDLAHLMVQAMA